MSLIVLQHHGTLSSFLIPARSHITFTQQKTRSLVPMSGSGTDLDVYGFVESGVPLVRYLRCQRTGWDFALHTRAPPPLFVDVDRFAPYRDTKIPLLLEAVARIQQRSLELNAFPTGKAEFWATIFPSHGKASGLQLGVEKWMMEDEAFPHIVLSFHQMQITKQRLGMLLQFMTSARDPTCEMPLPAIGLKFTQCEGFETESLELLLEFLDTMFAHPGRRFTIRSLNLSNNQMNVEQLTLLSELLDKNKRVYGIEDISLNDISFSRERDSDEADQITALLRGIFTDQKSSMETSDQPTSPSSPLQSPEFVLKRLSFDHSSLRLQHFAAICSALRYGCPVEELSLLSTLNRVSADDRQQCWRWVAFALFYPRSKRLKRSFHLEKIELSRIELRVADAKAIKNTLRDPAAELVYNARRIEGAAAGSANGGPQLCLVQQGSSIYGSPSTTSQCIATLDSERELEALVRDANGWVCVVFPGFGLGWIQVSQVVNLDGGENSYSPEIENLYELTIHRLSSKKAPISTLIECIGRHLSSLSLKYNTIDIKNIQTHCVSLKHLDVEGCSFQGSSMDAFLAKAHKLFFKRLVSLSLNDTVFNDEEAYKLAEALSSPDQLAAPALQELRIISGTLSFEAYKRIHKMLMANRTLSVIELVNPLKLLHSAELLLHFQHCHQGALLKIAGSARGKIAFLSALAHESALGTSRSVLDPNLTAMIFDFAGTPVRRRIMWRDSSDGDY